MPASAHKTLCCLRFERQGWACPDCPIRAALQRSMRPWPLRALLSRLRLYIGIPDMPCFRQGLNFFRRVFK